MRILITGGAGCLGSNLIERLLPQGHKIMVIDNFTTGRREVVPKLTGLTVVEGTIADRALVDECFAVFKPDCVVHSAASYKDPNDWIEDTETNVTGTIHVVNAAKANSVRRFINFQTALCYGRPSQVPIPVDAPTAPFTSYGVSKTAGEAYLAMSGLSYVSLRLANVTGPRLAIGPIPTFYSRLKNGHDCFCSDTQRDFLDMNDFLSLMELVMKDGAPTGVFNVSTGNGNTIKDIFDVVVDYLGIKLDKPVKVVPPSDGDVPAVVLDPSLTETTFGWRADVDFQVTIRNMLKWYDTFGVSSIYSHLADPTKENNG
ncbi:NAD-dependent epimerase/dehydratase family protein [Alphaproteobacteria bacterium]|nr:NAD-dependent epimerase/dehydratase family protein [Alphaproteobacteria bacterium]